MEFQMNLSLSLVGLAAALILSPFLRSIINRTKAHFAGRHGQVMLQPYFELHKLFRKSSVYSRTTTWIFKASPVVEMTTVFTALCMIPLGGNPALIHFNGDLLLFVYLLGLGRFCTILGAMDTGSSFEGMGASREAFFSALAEPSLLIGLGGIAAITHSLSLSEMYGRLNLLMLESPMAPALVFILFAFLIIFLTENARIPVDDPTTHLELTMIHEVMILDHSGFDLGLIEYAGSLKLWVLGLLLTGLILPLHTGSPWLNLGLAVGPLFLLAVCVGIIESTMARYKLIRIPQLLVIAFVLAALWIIWIARY